MKIFLPRFYSPDPEDRFTPIMPEDLSPEARSYLVTLAGYEITEKGRQSAEFDSSATPMPGLVDEQ